VGQGGVVYAGLGKEIDAFSGSGQVLWRYRKADGALTLAERSDGVLLVAGRHDLDAVQPDGKQLWGVQIGSSRGASAEERPFLLVDGDDTAYVGTGDGSVWVISAQGQWLSDLPAGGHENHRSPGLLLGPDGRLLVSGTDRVMRVYG
jgi:outer membrane protein assembly factor BamB